MHNNALALRWERKGKRREQDKEAKVSQGQADAVGSLLAFSKTPHAACSSALALGGQTKRRRARQEEK